MKKNKGFSIVIAFLLFALITISVTFFARAKISIGRRELVIENNTAFRYNYIETIVSALRTYRSLPCIFNISVTSLYYGLYNTSLPAYSISNNRKFKLVYPDDYLITHLCAYDGAAGNLNLNIKEERAPYRPIVSMPYPLLADKNKKSINYNNILKTFYINRSREGYTGEAVFRASARGSACYFGLSGSTNTLIPPTSEYFFTYYPLIINSQGSTRNLRDHNLSSITTSNLGREIDWDNETVDWISSIDAFKLANCQTDDMQPVFLTTILPPVDIKTYKPGYVPNISRNLETNKKQIAYDIVVSFPAPVTNIKVVMLTDNPDLFSYKLNASSVDSVPMVFVNVQGKKIFLTRTPENFSLQRNPKVFNDVVSQAIDVLPDISTIPSNRSYQNISSPAVFYPDIGESFLVLPLQINMNALYKIDSNMKNIIIDERLYNVNHNITMIISYDYPVATDVYYTNVVTNVYKLKIRK